VPFKKGFASGVKPEPSLTVSEWADKYRVLPSESSAEPGKWRTDRTPYLREIMDELSPQSPTPEVVVIKGTQLGFTELGNNVLFYYADLHPCPMLQVLHTEDIVRTHAKSKIWPSIEMMPRLSEKIKKSTSNKSGSSTTELIYPGGNWKLGWAQTKSTFASVSRRVVIGDDVDRWPLDVGGEGNPVELLKKRTDAFANRKIYINSTPTIKGASNIEKEFSESDQRHYYMPCPYCNEFITFEKEGFVYEYDEETYELLSDVKYKCPECGEFIEEHYKTWMMDKKNGAKWIPSKPGRKKRGYRLPSYYSPIGWLTWNSIFTEYLIALKKQKENHDNRSMIVWTNTRDANVWEETIEATESDDMLLLKRSDYEPGLVPHNTAFLVMSVDVQLDHFWYEVRALQYGNSKHILRYGRAEDWTDLEDIFSTYYEDRDGKKYMVRICAIDSGYRTDEVYEFCAMNSNICIPIKGIDKMTSPWRISDVTKEKDGVSIATGLKLYSINTEYFKDMLQANIDRSIAAAKEGNLNQNNILTLHCETGEDFAKQYTSEYKAEEVNSKTGAVKYIWKKRYSRAPNHLWDCGVYNTFLGELLGIRFLRKEKSIKQKAKKRQVVLSSSNYMDDF